MSRKRNKIPPLRAIALLLWTLASVTASHAATTLAGPAILVDESADEMARDGARDLRIYWYRMTGQLLPSMPTTPEMELSEVPADSFVIGRIDANPLLQRLARTGELGLGDTTIGPEGFKLKTIATPKGVVTVVAAQTGRGVMYGCYELLERYGVRFFTEHDTIPDLRGKVPELRLDVLEEPRLAVRGSLPWSNFISSPFVWDLGDYYRYLDQMAKQKYNLLMIHVYPEEPYLRFTYKGESYAVRRGDVSASLWQEKASMKEMPYGLGGFFLGPTFGSAANVHAKSDEEAFLQTSAMLRQAIAYAHRRGIKVCIGFEVGFETAEIRKGIPADAWIHDQKLIDPTSAAAEEILEIRIRTLVETYPEIDYVGFWQPEAVFLFDVPEGKSARFDEFRRKHAAKFSYETDGALTQKAKSEGKRRIDMDLWTAWYFQRATSLLQKIAPEKTAVIGGWGGSAGNRGQLLGALEGLDALLPKNVVMTYLVGLYGLLNVAPVFGEIQGREKWPISWFEGDYALWYPSYNVHLMDRQLAGGARRGATGWVGIHWRTQNVEPAVSYVARKLWDESLTPETFYADYARSEYGGDQRLAEVLLRLDRDTRFVASPEWTGYKAGAPTGALSDKQQKALLSTIAFLEGAPASVGTQQERLELLRHALRATAALDEVGRSMQRVFPRRAKKGEKVQEPTAAERREQLVAALPELRRAPMDVALMQTASRAYVKEHLGLLVNLSAVGHDYWLDVIEQVESDTGQAHEPLPPSTATFTPHTFLWARSPVYETGKPEIVKAIVATNEPVKVALRYRKMGAEELSTVAMERGFGMSYQGTLPASALQGDVLEYFIEVASASDGRPIPGLRYPKGASSFWMVPLGPAIAHRPPEATKSGEQAVMR